MDPCESGCSRLGLGPDSKPEAIRLMERPLAAEEGLSNNIPEDTRDGMMQGTL